MTLSHQLSFQLYSAREFPPLSDQLQILAALGFKNVEPFGGLYADARGLKEALDRNGLCANSGHFDLLTIEADPKATVEIANILGTQIIVAPWLDEQHRPTDIAGWKDFGTRLSKLQAYFSAEGLVFVWHNHDFEFRTLPDGSMPIDHILGGNSVGLELDVAWVVRAGHDPVAWINKFADRLVSVHVKDIAPAGQNASQDGWAHLGQGVIDWKAIWPAIERSKATLAILEHDRPQDWKAFVSESAAAFRVLAGDVA